MARILVIDDERNIRTTVGAALRHVGHEVETAADGGEGLEKFGRGTAWDLTLLDQRMPGMEGIEVLREVRRRDPQARVIMITAFGTVDLAVEAMKAGAADFLRKPFTTEVLRGAVTVALGHQAAEVASMEAGVTYALTTFNGFTIESQPRRQATTPDGIENVFGVCPPEGEAVPVSVVLSPILLEQVRGLAGGQAPPGGERFWHALCEESLANYVWQHASCPPGARLQVNDLTADLRQWVTSVLQPGR